MFLDVTIRSGIADDGVLTVGFTDAGGFGSPLCGYDVLTGFGATDPSEPSVLSILGRATGSVDYNGRQSLSDGATFSIQYVRFSSLAAANKWSHFRLGDSEYPFLSTIRQGNLYYRNIQGYPDDLGYAAGQVLGDVITLTWNLKTESGQYLLQGPGSVQLSPRGFYEKLRTGYSRIPSSGYHYTHGTGAPTGKPQHPDQWFRNEFGDVYPAAGFPRLRDEIVNSAGTLLSLDGNVDDYSNHALYARNAVAGWGQLAPEGAIRWSYDIHTTGLNIFRQKRDGAEYPIRLTWQEWTQFLVDVNPDPSFLRLRDHSRLLGIFSAHADAFDFLDEQITQQEFDSLATDYYYCIESSDTSFNANPKGGIYKVTAFSASHLVYDDSDLHWQGPLFDRDRLTTWLHNNPDTLVTELKLGGYQVLPLPDQPAVGDTSSDAGKVPVVQDDGTSVWEIGAGGETRTTIFESTIQPLGTNYRQIGDIDVPLTGDIEMSALWGNQARGGSFRFPAVWMTNIVGTTAVVFSDSTTALNQITWECANRRLGISRTASGKLLLAAQSGNTTCRGLRLVHIT